MAVLHLEPAEVLDLATALDQLVTLQAGRLARALNTPVVVTSAEREAAEASLARRRALLERLRSPMQEAS